MSIFSMPLNPPMREWTGRWVWVIGASSGIGRATASALHRLGARVIVSARQADALSAFVHIHQGSLSLPLDVTQHEQLRRAAQSVQRYAQGAPALVMYCAGHYKPQQATAFDRWEMEKHLAINYRGALNMLDVVLPMLTTARSGHISLVGSVAGYRGLPKSLAYGPTKAALHNLAENLYLDLHPLGLGVSIVNPGFVETPLTAHNDFPMPALMTADDAAKALVDGLERGQFHIHFPRRFTNTLRLARLLPYRAYFWLVHKVTGL